MGNIVAKLVEEKFKSVAPFLHAILSRKSCDEMVADFQNCSQVRTLNYLVESRRYGVKLNRS